MSSIFKKSAKKYETNDKDVEIENIDNRSRTFTYVAAMLFLLSISIMVLSIVATANFGDDYEESFSMPDSNLQYRNQTLAEDESGIDYNSEGYKMIHQCKFDRYFIQGTEILPDKKTLLISSGLYSKSKLIMLKFNMEACSFETVYSWNMDAKYFAEGLTVANDDQIFQLTYKENQVLVWDLNTQKSATTAESYSPKLKDIRGMPKNNKLKQGWGLAYAKLDSGEHRLYATDGTSNIYVIDPVAWETLRTIEVTYGGMPINSLNELEIIKTSSLSKNYIFANQFIENTIWMIDLRTGVAVSQWNMKELKDIQYKHIKKVGESTYDKANAVLNGIAYYESNDSFLISGKLWDFIYEIKFDYHNYMK